MQEFPCYICGNPLEVDNDTIHERFENYSYTVKDENGERHPVHKECYFEELGKTVDKHPIGTPVII